MPFVSYTIKGGLNISRGFNDKNSAINHTMLDLFKTIGDGDGENGGKGSLWNCAPEIYETIKSGHRYCYADCEWWIESK